MFISQHFPLASSWYTIIILQALFLRSNKGNKIVCFQKFCPKFVLTQKVSKNISKSRHSCKNRSKHDTSWTLTFSGHHLLERGRSQHVYFYFKCQKMSAQAENQPHLSPFPGYRLLPCPTEVSKSPSNKKNLSGLAD